MKAARINSEKVCMPTSDEISTEIMAKENKCKPEQLARKERT